MIRGKRTGAVAPPAHRRLTYRSGGTRILVGINNCHAFVGTRGFFAGNDPALLPVNLDVMTGFRIFNLNDSGFRLIHRRQPRPPDNNTSNTALNTGQLTKYVAPLVIWMLLGRLHSRSEFNVGRARALKIFIRFRICTK